MRSVPIFSIVASAAVDLAARRGVPCVRRHAQVPQVAAYDQAQGFDLVREEQRTHARLWMLARKSEVPGSANRAMRRRRAPYTSKR